MKDKGFLVFVAFGVVSILFMLFLMFGGNNSACVKINNDMFFTESLRVYSNGAVSFHVDDERIFSNSATYFYVENENDCRIIEEILD